MNNGNTQNLADRIAQLLQENEKPGDDFLRASLEKIRRSVFRSSFEYRSSDAANAKKSCSPTISRAAVQKISSLIGYG